MKLTFNINSINFKKKENQSVISKIKMSTSTTRDLTDRNKGKKNKQNKNQLTKPCKEDQKRKIEKI